VGVAQGVAGGQQVVGAVLADRAVDGRGPDARLPQRLHRVGLLAPLLRAQPLGERVARRGELVVGERVERVGLVEHATEGKARGL
jgi:hypothetical protein